MRFSALLNLVVIIYLQFSIDNFKLRELFSTRVNSELSRWPHLKLMLVCSYVRVCVCALKRWIADWGSSQMQLCHLNYIEFRKSKQTNRQKRAQKKKLIKFFFFFFYSFVWWTNMLMSISVDLHLIIYCSNLWKMSERTNENFQFWISTGRYKRFQKSIAAKNEWKRKSISVRW